jgi:hypothetical protein
MDTPVLAYYLKEVNEQSDKTSQATYEKEAPKAF